MATRIRNADIVIAYDPAADDHVYRRDLDVVFDESGILHLGAGFSGEVSREIDGKGFMVMPGLVDIHSHPSSEPGNKGMTDEPIVMHNLRYWGAPRNDGFVMMQNEVEAYRIGKPPFEFKRTNGFMITFDITSKDVAAAKAATPMKGY